MNRVIGYSCAYASTTESFKFAFELKGEEEKAEVIVSSAEAVETLLDLFEDSTSARYDGNNGEIVFSFDYSPSDDSEDEDAEVAEETDGAEEEGGKEARAA